MLSEVQESWQYFLSPEFFAELYPFNMEMWGVSWCVSLSPYDKIAPVMARYCHLALHLIEIGVVPLQLRTFFGESAAEVSVTAGVLTRYPFFLKKGISLLVGLLFHLQQQFCLVKQLRRGTGSGREVQFPGLPRSSLWPATVSHKQLRHLLRAVCHIRLLRKWLCPKGTVVPLANCPVLYTGRSF